MRNFKAFAIQILAVVALLQSGSAFAIFSQNTMQCYAPGADVRFKGNATGTVGTWTIDGRSIRVGRGGDYVPTGGSISPKYMSRIITMPGLTGTPGLFFASSRGYLVRLNQGGFTPSPFIVGGITPLLPNFGFGDEFSGLFGDPILPHQGERILFDGDLQCVSLQSIY